MMSPERWQQIKKVYYAALEVNANERAKFLDEACAGDDSLHREVESLLASHERSGTFLAGPALEMAARAIADNESRSIVGREVGPYHVRSLLGAGGMGEVYLAEDARLARPVALKLLVSHFAGDEDRLRRFQQEALAASALNHPNIVTVYEVGEWEGKQFIATEFVEGTTLRARMRSRRLSLADSIDIALQIAGALAAAHGSGIVHRDIKPENVMVRPDGLLKVLDFGIAKYTAKAGTRAKREALVQTTPGLPIGTAAYMSPEQARGLSVDARTDIWSLGVILYEMITRRLPFPGATPTDRIAAILEREPTPISEQRRGLPPQLEQVINRMLAKNKDERYGEAAELAADLRKLRATLGPERRAGFDLPMPMRSLTSLIRSRLWVAVLSLVLLVGAIIGGYLYFSGRFAADQATRIDSIAVMPLVNVTNDPNTEYLSDGITESIISNLSQLPQLRVMARTSVFSFKGKEIDPKVAGQQLGVQSVLVGRLMQQGERLVIRTELVKVADGTQIWGAEYDRSLSDVLNVQQEISREISGALRLKLTGEEQNRLTAHGTRNSEAYQLYLKGRFHWNKFTEEGVRKSLSYFTQALAKDENYALAYVGLSDAYQLLGQIGQRPNEVTPKGLPYVEKALTLDDTLAEAHTARAAYDLFYGWNWVVVERELKRALELNPSYAPAHDLYGQYLSGKGRHNDAIASNKRALLSDPLSVNSNANLALVNYYARHYDEAIEQCRKTLELEPNFFYATLYTGWAYGQQGKYEAAIAELNKMRDLREGFVPATSELGYVYAISGRRAEAQKLVKELQERATHEFIDPYYVAIIYLGLDDQEQTFAWLNRAHQERSSWLLWMRVEPKFDRLRSDARFAELVQRVGLAQ